MQAIDRILPAAKHQRPTLFGAVKDALFLRETERMREAYRLHPYAAESAEVWGLPEEWKE